MPDVLELISNADEGVYAVDSEQKIILEVGFAWLDDRCRLTRNPKRLTGGERGTI
ncbi:MAG: hypothetical protein IH955_09540 [Chloroflexi bacterium]|nr:hypothetical protein [Chloroflexota bacterium]